MRALVLALLATPAVADADASWEAWRAEVEAACRALVAGQPGEVAVEVNPFGSEGYGVALLTVTSEAGTDRLACVVPKGEGAGPAELTAPFAPLDDPAGDLGG